MVRCRLAVIVGEKDGAEDGAFLFLVLALGFMAVRHIGLLDVVKRVGLRLGHKEDGVDASVPILRVVNVHDRFGIRFAEGAAVLVREETVGGGDGGPYLVGDSFIELTCEIDFLSFGNETDLAQPRLIFAMMNSYLFYVMNISNAKYNTRGDGCQARNQYKLVQNVIKTSW